MTWRVPHLTGVIGEGVSPSKLVDGRVKMFQVMGVIIAVMAVLIIGSAIFGY